METSQQLKNCWTVCVLYSWAVTIILQAEWYVDFTIDRIVVGRLRCKLKKMSTPAVHDQPSNSEDVRFSILQVYFLN